IRLALCALQITRRDADRIVGNDYLSARTSAPQIDRRGAVLGNFEHRNALGTAHWHSVEHQRRAEGKRIAGRSERQRDRRDKQHEQGTAKVHGHRLSADAPRRAWGLVRPVSVGHFEYSPVREMRMAGTSPAAASKNEKQPPAKYPKSSR